MRTLILALQQLRRPSSHLGDGSCTKDDLHHMDFSDAVRVVIDARSAPAGWRARCDPREEIVKMVREAMP